MKNSKIGQNSMKKWPFFAIILPWMASYGSKRSFLLILSAKDDLVKVSWKSDARKYQNHVTPPYFDQLSERCQLLWEQWGKLTKRWFALFAIPITHSICASTFGRIAFALFQAVYFRIFPENESCKLFPKFYLRFAYQEDWRILWKKF